MSRRSSGLGRRELLGGLLGLGAAGSLGPLEAMDEQAHLTEPRSALDRLAASPPTSRSGAAYVHLRLHAAFAACKELRLVKTAPPWIEELDRPHLSVQDPEPWRRSRSTWTRARRAAGLERAGELARALQLRYRVCFVSAEDLLQFD